MSEGIRDLLRWDEYAAQFLAHGPKQQIAYELQLFRSRWRLAWHFQGLSAPGVADATVDGYSAAFRVFLAYTAHEQLSKAIGRKHDFMPFDDPKLASDIRARLVALKPLTLAHAQGKQRQGLEEFWQGPADDVRYFAYGLRNLVAHGPFTANKVKTRDGQSTLFAVARLILHSSEELFGMVVDDLIAQSPP